ncbi:glycosyltransferase family 4 protein [Streptomyces cinerochromogenes]|uniref:glycosyltransferase family 4 protein n=1 Tax=Streptomyces cinerochromogenes TaxID=66422 RepID=UPI00166FB67E|nr:glycosyltransferase family 4 protein [Streptomyces cinerochromogenes]GGS45989.1 glycosyl transferase family 1 [Streptomyces cinerochromogenes]
MHQSAPAHRPRVLHLAQPVDGGVARVVLDLARAQLAAGLHVTAACPGGALAAGLRELGADVRDWRAGRSPGPGLPGEVRRLARLVDEVRPELVHAHSAKAGLAARLAVRGRVPTVFQPHAWSFEAVGGLTAALALGWERWGARWADRVVCVSEAERTTGLRAGVRAAYAVIPNGIDTTRFTPLAPQGPQGPQAPRPPRAHDPQGSHGPQAADGGNPLVVCVGRLCRQKAQDVLLAAWPEILVRLPRARLVLVGDGPDREVLRRQAPPSVRFTGAVADAAPWYRAADLVVLPSRWEGMALAPLEALACGAPVVLTDVDGARESLPPALAAHCLVPPEDPVALAAAVTGLLADPPLRAALAGEGRRHVLATHDVRHTAERVADLYRELLGAPGPGRGALAADEAGGTARPVPSECREAAADVPSECRESIPS